MDTRFSDFEYDGRKHPRYLLPIEHRFGELCNGMDDAVVDRMLSLVPLRALYKARWGSHHGFLGMPFPIDPASAKIIVEADYPDVYHRNDLVLSLRPVDCVLRGVTMLSVDDMITLDVMEEEHGLSVAHGVPFLRANLRERERERQKGYASVPPLPAEIRFYS